MDDYPRDSELKSKSVRYEQIPSASAKAKRSVRQFSWAVPSLITVCAIAAIWLFTDNAKPTLQAAEQPHRLFSKAPTNSWNLQFDNPQPVSANAVLSPKASAEEMVENVYSLLRSGERTAALVQTQHLANRFPNFQLGQLLYADLLNEGLAAPVDPKEIEGKETASGQNRYDELLLESDRRLNRTPASALKGLVPSNIISLSPLTPYVIAVDASKSRLYWFANKTVDPLKPALELVLDTYISVGQKGIGKLREGDGRTPMGVYFVNKSLKGQTLPDLYGAGALTLNYPNAVDLMRGKTGSGIWLHGTPNAQYARAPWATDGCVVMSNPEMDRLLRLKNVEKTPVVISDKLEWTSADRSVPAREGFTKTLNQWILDRQTSNLEGLKNTYSPQYQRDGKGLAVWWPEIVSAVQMGPSKTPVDLQSIIEWKDANDFIVVNVTNPNSLKNKTSQQLRMYWAKTGNSWQIIYEGPV